MDNFCVSIVKNKVIDIIRYRNHFTDKEIEEMNFYKESEAASPEQAVLRSEMNKMLERVLQEISEVYREAMLLKYVHGLSYKEIAKLQGVSEKTVEQRIYRGKQKLKEVIHEAEAE